MKEKYEIHIVSHTHWDREWYSTNEEYRIRLCNLFNKLIRIFSITNKYKHFVLDGQTSLIEDYLGIYPENKKKLRRYIKSGKLIIGPWYVQSDEFLVSGESIIRNLLIGHRISKDFGCNPMKVGYLPDQFGHISQMPQILNGFGIRSAIFSRGLSEIGEKLGSEFWWESPDGSKVLAIHQIDGYGNAAALGYIQPDFTGNSRYPIDFEKALSRSKELINLLSKYANTRYLLFNNGVDHYEPQKDLPEIIEYLNKNLRNVRVLHSNFEHYVKKIILAKVNFKKYVGEMRGSYYNFLLPGVLSTRIYLKQKNTEIENLLYKYVEPLSTFAWLEGAIYPEKFLLRSLKYLLLCHPHDSICGCSNDRVITDVINRLNKVQEICELLRKSSYRHIIQKINTDFSKLIHNKVKIIPVVVFNTLSWERTDVVTAELIYPANTNNDKRKFVVIDLEGSRIINMPTYCTSLSNTLWSLERGTYRRREITFLARNVPSCGYKVFYLKPIDEDISGKIEIKAGENFIENNYLKIVVNTNGTINIEDKIHNISFKNLHVFEDIEDAGDEYNFSPTKQAKKISSENSKCSVMLYEKNPLFATLKINIDLLLPESLDNDRNSRSENLVSCPIESYITVFSNSNMINFKTIICNNAKDHKIQAVFPLDINTSYFYADSSFDVVKRKVNLNVQTDWRFEESPRVVPQKTFLSINDENKGITIVNCGLPEAEVNKTENGVSVAITLLRCIGWLSRDDLLTRKGHAGPPIEAPDAQCLGKHEFHYAIILHKGDWQKNKIWKYAQEFVTPLKGVMTTQHQGELPEVNSFIEINPDCVILSAIKKAEHNNGLILRLWNISSKKVLSKIKLYKKIKRAELVSMDEISVRKKIKLSSKNEILVHFEPFKINTVCVIFKE